MSTLLEQKALIDESIVAINKNYLDGLFKEAISASKDLATAVEAYNKELREAEYDKWLATDRPVLTALKQGQVEQLAVKQSKVKDTDIPCVSLKTPDGCNPMVLVDLMELFAYSREKGIKKPIFQSAQWHLQCELFARLITEKVANDVDASTTAETVRSNFALTGEAMVEDVAFKDATVKDEAPSKLSNTSLKKAGKIILQNIQGECVPSKGKLVDPEFTTHDLNYLCTTVCHQSSRKVHTVTCPKKETIIKAMTHIMIAKVNGQKYGLDYKTK